MQINELDRPHLYLDMDGVQADFFSAWAQQFGKDRYKQIGDKAEREESITALNQRGPEFIQELFANLPVLPGGQKLVAWIKHNRIPFTVLSAPLRNNHEASIAGKKRWLDKHNPGTSATAVFTGAKERLAMAGGRPNVLVDDYKKYIQTWGDAGGIAVLYRDDNVDNVIQQLSQIYGIAEQ